jgi:hypothetical protein
MTINFNVTSKTTNRFDFKEAVITCTSDHKDPVLHIKLNDTELTSVDTSQWNAQIIERANQNASQSKDPLVWHQDANGWSFTYLLTRANISNKGENTYMGIDVLFTPPAEEWHLNDSVAK